MFRRTDTHKFGLCFFYALSFFFFLSECVGFLVFIEMLRNVPFDSVTGLSVSILAALFTIHHSTQYFIWLSITGVALAHTPHTHAHTIKWNPWTQKKKIVMMQCNFLASNSDKMYLCDSNFVVNRILLFLFYLLLLVAPEHVTFTFPFRLVVSCFFCTPKRNEFQDLKKTRRKHRFWLFRSFVWVFAVNGNSDGFHVL